jgi:hypothetical protein
MACPRLESSPRPVVFCHHPASERGQRQASQRASRRASTLAGRGGSSLLSAASVTAGIRTSSGHTARCRTLLRKVCCSDAPDPPRRELRGHVYDHFKGPRTQSPPHPSHPPDQGLGCTVAGRSTTGTAARTQPQQAQKAARGVRKGNTNAAGALGRHWAQRQACKSPP